MSAPLGPRRRFAILLLRAALIASLIATAVALHMPAPSGVSSASADDVRGAWTLVGAIARAGAALLPDVPDALDPLVSDKTIHFGLFLMLSFFWASARALGRALDRRGALLVLVVLCVYAGVGELAQALEGRVAELGDWVANVLGAAAGTLLALALHRASRSVRAARRRPQRQVKSGVSPSTS